ncbi:MAG: hypothetical protein GOU99_00435 [Candidatus Altiarchaeota archaeon]|nr:hypothetical protein [Candidatus Altiarchaeota archaeon]
MGNDGDHVKRYEDAGMVRIDGKWYHKDHIKEYGLQKTKAIYADIERHGREQERARYEAENGFWMRDSFTQELKWIPGLNPDKASDKSSDKSSYKK